MSKFYLSEGGAPAHLPDAHPDIAALREQLRLKDLYITELKRALGVGDGQKPAKKFALSAGPVSKELQILDNRNDPGGVVYQLVDQKAGEGYPTTLVVKKRAW